jgi:putative endonuclease
MGSGLQRSRRQRLGAAGYRRGHWAEYWAMLWLRLHGYRVLAHRWRCHAGEIDIVAWRRGVLVAVEVKARPTVADGLLAIRPEQQQRLLRALETYAGRCTIAWESLRLDALVVVPWRLPMHLPDAWQQC